MRKELLKGYVFIILSAVIFGCMPLGVKSIYAGGVNSISVVFLRNLLPLPVLALLAVKKQGSLRIPQSALKDVAWIALMGCTVTPILLFSSYSYISSGTATVFHFVYPAVTVLASMVFLREKVRSSSLVCILVCTVGIFLFYDPKDPIDLRGSAIALLSGVTYAIYILLLARRQSQEVAGFKLAFYTASMAAIVLFFVCVLTGQLTLPKTVDVWLIAIVFSHVVQVGAVLLFQMGTALVGGQRAAILSTFEPITSLIVGVLVFNETIGWRTIFGSVLVIAATALVALADLRDEA